MSLIVKKPQLVKKSTITTQTSQHDDVELRTTLSGRTPPQTSRRQPSHQKELFAQNYQKSMQRQASLHSQRSRQSSVATVATVATGVTDISKYGPPSPVPRGPPTLQKTPSIVPPITTMSKFMSMSANPFDKSSIAGPSFPISDKTQPASGDDAGYMDVPGSWEDLYGSGVVTPPKINTKIKSKSSAKFKVMPKQPKIYPNDPNRQINDEIEVLRAQNKAYTDQLAEMKSTYETVQNHNRMEEQKIRHELEREKKAIQDKTVEAEMAADDVEQCTQQLRAYRETVERVERQRYEQYEIAQQKYIQEEREATRKLREEIEQKYLEERRERERIEQASMCVCDMCCVKPASKAAMQNEGVYLKEKIIL